MQLLMKITAYGNDKKETIKNININIGLFIN